MKRSYIIFIFLFFYFLICTSSAQGFSLNLNPPSLRLTVGTGETVSGKISLENSGNSILTIKAYVQDWVYAKDGSKDFKEAGSTPHSCADWITLNPTKFEINPNEIKEIEYTLSVPEYASGGNYAVIFFESIISEPKGSGVAIAGRIGTIVYQETKGRVNKKGSILDLSACKECKPLKVSLVFINEGDTQLQADGKVVFEDSSGNPVAELEIPRIYTLPGDLVKKELEWSKIDLKKGRYILKGIIDYGGAEEATFEKEFVVD